jgi:hypothetical protein
LLPSALRNRNKHSVDKADNLPRINAENVDQSMPKSSAASVSVS